MNLHLSWDLFILVFFAVVIAYSFIIGRNQTLKVILGTYIAILCADGLGNLFAKYFASSEAFLRFLKLFSIGGHDQAIAFFKVFVLLVLIVLIAVRGLFQVEVNDSSPATLKLGMLLLLGILSGGLMVSAVLVFISGTSLIGAAANGANILTDVYTASHLARIMVDYANFWFFLPGVTFVTMGFLHKKSA